MPLIATRGAASAQGFGEFAQTAMATYIEDVFSTYLYTGNGSTQTITNNIDLSGEGGLVWIKQRTDAAHALYDTVRGVRKAISSNFTLAELTAPSGNELTAFNSNGFSLGTDSNYNVNSSSTNYASWTFRKAEKFFDVVTYVGNADTTPSRTVNHNLGSVPGCIIVKEVTQTGNWDVYHRSLGATKVLFLNLTNASSTDSLRWNDTEPTSTQFTVGSENNSQGVTYVAYLFAHNAGGFGLTGSDNVITCGSYTGNGSATGPTINLGYEPQWILLKRATGDTNSWFVFDSMRGMVVGGNDPYLIPNASNAEDNTLNVLSPTATGFQITNSVSGVNANGSTYIYIAIRRGPMKTPTSGTEVFYPYVTASASNVGSTSGTMYNSQIVTDHAWQKAKGGTDGWYLGARLTGTAYMKSETTAAESTSAAIVWDSNRGAWAFSDPNYGLYCFKRAPGFFDVVCYTGNSTGSTTQTLSHNLTTTPELIIIKGRSAIKQWEVQCSFGVSNYKFLRLNLTDQAYTESYDNANIYASAPTSTQFQLGGQTDTNGNTVTYVAYLFASLSGISKVGSYTGTGTTLQVNCGFTNGSRFVMIKRTDSTGDWYVWDSARGIVAGNDPYLLLNSTAAEVTNTDYVDTFSSGFEISSTAPAGINANGGTYIFLAIA